MYNFAKSKNQNGYEQENYYLIGSNDCMFEL